MAMVNLYLLEIGKVHQVNGRLCIHLKKDYVIADDNKALW